MNSEKKGKVNRFLTELIRLGIVIIPMIILLLLIGFAGLGMAILFISFLFLVFSIKIKTDIDKIKKLKTDFDAELVKYDFITRFFVDILWKSETEPRILYFLRKMKYTFFVSISISIVNSAASLAWFFLPSGVFTILLVIPVIILVVLNIVISNLKPKKHEHTRRPTEILVISTTKKPGENKGNKKGEEVVH